MDRALRRYTEMINYRNKLNEVHPEWNFVDVIQLSQKLAAIRLPISQEHVALLALHMPSDTHIEACGIMIKNIRRNDQDDTEATENMVNAVLLYWNEALQLTEEEYEKIKPDLINIADAWAE